VMNGAGSIAGTRFLVALPLATINEIVLSGDLF
jgi:hypothetical protein